MRILYGIHAHDNGHLNRSQPIIKSLRSKGASVDVVFSGKQLPDSNHYVRQLMPIKQYQGVHDVIKNGKNQYLKTFFNLQISQLIKDIKALDLSGYDMVLNDFDHVSAWAAKFQKKRCIGLNRASTFRYQVPSQKRYAISKFVFSHITPCTIPVGFHWHHFNQPILPPIITLDKTKAIAESDENFILVYLAAENLQTLCHVLQQVEDKFKLFHPKITKEKKIHNLHLCPIVFDEFKESLRQCKGIITHAGFNTITEALVLGKPILVKPKKRFVEQMANAYALKHLNLAQCINKITPLTINKWRENSKPIKPLIYPKITEQLADWILNEKGEELPKFAKSIWANIDNGFDQ